jgi:hypothetical protein
MILSAGLKGRHPQIARVLTFIDAVQKPTEFYEPDKRLRRLLYPGNAGPP